VIYISGIYLKKEYLSMAKVEVARLFRNGRSQAVRLPQEFRFEGDRVRVRRVGKGVLLEPFISDVRQWFAAMDSLKAGRFMAKGRKQPRTPRREIFE
jgi:antitoxin VapB